MDLISPIRLGNTIYFLQEYTLYPIGLYLIFGYDRDDEKTMPKKSIVISIAFNLELHSLVDYIKYQ
jgi:hypothetical protein